MGSFNQSAEYIILDDNEELLLFTLYSADPAYGVRTGLFSLFFFLFFLFFFRQ